MSRTGHALIRKGSIQPRLYQESILATASSRHTLCVLPTGLGKTQIAIMLAALRLERWPGSRVLVMAPTRPLVNQHLRSFSGAMNLERGDFQVLTGLLGPEKRRGLYAEKRVLLATPQVIRNDIESGLLSLENYSLLVIDEAHHSVGEYAYPRIARVYLEQAAHPRILGLTASPGGTREKIEEIRKNIGAEAVEIRTEEDGDTLPYIKGTEMEWIGVDLPESFRKIREYVLDVFQGRVSALKRMGLVRGRVSKKELLLVQQRLQREAGEGKGWAYAAASTTAEAIKLEHALMLLETQGVTNLQRYWNRLKGDGSRAARKIVKDRRISHAMHLTNSLFESGSTHPKMSRLCSVVQEELSQRGDSRIIVFANFRDTVKEIVSALKGIEGARPVGFVGQKNGLTQKEQLSRLRDFRDRTYNVLVGTSVSEEGLSIEGADLAVFYEPVPSEIRSIQRRGRVGRYAKGRVVILVTRDTRDQAYYWTSQRKEKRMRDVVSGMKKQGSLRGLP